MARGTWQGSGTWQTSGPDLGGIARMAALGTGAALVTAFIAEILLWLAVITACLLVAAVVAVVVVWRHTRRREAEYAAALVARHEPPTLTATVTPQVTQPERPAIPQVVNFNFYAADGTMTARVIRQAIPGTAGAAITEGKRP